MDNTNNNSTIEDISYYNTKITDMNLNYRPNSNKNIGVVYLAYFNEKLNYKINYVQNFFDKYTKNPSGIDHELIIAAKNWTDKNEFNDLCHLVKKNNAKIIYLPDDGLDFGAYIRAAKIIQNDYIFCLGSNVDIRKENWLKYLYKALKEDKCLQLVGPMGSWEKGFSDKFPNPHIRTNAFLVKRDLFVEYAESQPFPTSKQDTYKMEHCSTSLSNFILQKGYKMAVVNSDGKIFAPDDWPKSQTYITTEESKLLMADKWVRRYENADEYIKLQIEMVVWGENYIEYPKNLITEFSEKINIFIPYSEIIEPISTKIFHPIITGAVDAKLKTKAFKDNNGINISHKNKLYGDLTAYYWIWNNFLPQTKSEYIGFCQNGRVLDFNIAGKDKTLFAPIYINDFKKALENYTEEKIFDSIKDFDVILPEKTLANTSILEQYLITEKKEDFDIALNVIRKNYPEYSDSIDKFLSSNSMYFFGNFVMKKELLNDFFEWLFDILDKTEKYIDEDTYTKNNDILKSKFMIDRFLNIWLTYNQNQRNLKIKSTTSFEIFYDMQKYLQKCLQKVQEYKNSIQKGAQI